MPLPGESARPLPSPAPPARSNNGTVDYREMNKALRRRVEDPSHLTKDAVWVGMRHNVDSTSLARPKHGMHLLDTARYTDPSHSPHPHLTGPGGLALPLSARLPTVSPAAASPRPPTADAAGALPSFRSLRLKVGVDSDGRQTVRLPSGLSQEQYDAVLARTAASLQARWPEERIELASHPSRRRVVLSPRLTQ